MLAASEVTIPPQNLPKITPKTKAPFRSALTRHEPGFVIALSPTKLKDLAGITKKVSAIKNVAIAAPAAPGLKAPTRPLGQHDRDSGSKQS